MGVDQVQGRADTGCGETGAAFLIRHSALVPPLSLTDRVGTGALCLKGSTMKCTCYASKLDDETRFTLRYGAHNPRCPAYRESGDPVDNMHDADFRATWEPRVRHRAVSGQRAPYSVHPGA